MKNRQFDYNPPSFDETVERAERKGSLFDLLFKDVKIYRAKQGANLLRILPPGWPKARHFGLYVKIHRDVGPDNRAYLCTRENESSPYKQCPVCEALYKLGPKATQEDRKLLRSVDNVVYYVIDRDNEKDGVQVWMTSPATDSEIAAQMVNRRTKSVLNIVEPENGYDIEFTRTGTTRNNTRYRGYQIMRESSPLSDSDKWFDEWLDTVFDKPLPSILNFYSPEHIEKVFYGKAKEEVTEERGRVRDHVEDDEVEESRPLQRRREVESEPEPEAEDTTPRAAPRSRLARDLDDEIPDHHGLFLDDVVDETPRRVRDEEVEDRPVRRPRRVTIEEDEEEEVRPTRTRPSATTREVDSDPNENRRERMRQRLNRE